MALMSPLLQQVIEALRCLPGVGPKTAQRMTFHLLLERHRDKASYLAETLLRAVAVIQRCAACRTLCEETLCGLCTDSRRDAHLLCVVETPSDLFAIEHMGLYKGRYFVLHGRLSPLDGIGPSDLGIEQLQAYLQQTPPRELILATNPTVEGEATAHYLSELAKHYQIPASRIAYGVPLGGELEYVDSGTLAHAFEGREMVV